MKKNIFILGLMALAATVTSCSKNDDDNNNIIDPDVTTMPEGTSDPRVTINETDADYNDPRYQANWGNYAEAVSSHLKNDAETLYKAWNEGLNGGEAFQTTFKEAKGAYHSYNDCIEQILDGCIDIANEVGESKIGDPRDKWENKLYTEAVYAVESWYSYHSIQDYANNIRSIQNAFFCTYNGKQGQHSIAAYLSKNAQPELAKDVNDRIVAAIVAIEGMAAPFRNHIGNPTVLTAMEACDRLKSVLRTLKAEVENFDNEEELRNIVADYVDVVVVNEQPVEGVNAASSVADGEYELTGAWTFTAAPVVVAGATLRPKYKIETLVGNEWVKTASDWGNSCTITAGDAPVRLTWQWQKQSGLVFHVK